MVQEGHSTDIDFGSDSDEESEEYNEALKPERNRAFTEKLNELFKSELGCTIRELPDHYPGIYDNYDLHISYIYLCMMTISNKVKNKGNTVEREMLLIELFTTLQKRLRKNSEQKYDVPSEKKLLDVLVYHDEDILLHGFNWLKELDTDIKFYIIYDVKNPRV